MLKDNDRKILQKEFCKKCWQADYVPLVVCIAILFLNSGTPIDAYSIFSSTGAAINICAVILMINTDKKYLVDIMEKGGTENSEKYEPRIKKIKIILQMSCVFSVWFYIIGML